MTAIVVGRPLATGIAAVAGLLIGSFLNVVAYRVPRRLSVIAPGSFCPSCRAPIRGYDNVPVVSWLVLRGRCRHCGAPISGRYAVVEGATALLFALCAAAVGGHWPVVGLVVLVATVVALALVELDGGRPPATVAAIGSAMGTVVLIAAAAGGHRWWRLGGALMGAGFGLLCIVAASRVDRRPAGADRAAWSIVPAGAFLGWLGLVGSGAGALGALVAVFVEHRTQRHASMDGTTTSSPSLAVAMLTGVVVALVAAWAAGETARV